MQEKKGQNYLHGAAILAAAAIIVKILGAVYKIALGNIIGDEGYGHFMVAHNIYNLLLTLSTAGLPIAVSRMIASADALNRRNQVKRIYSVATVSFCLLGALGTSIMLFFPNALAMFFRDPDAAKSIQALSPSIFLVCLMSAYRGYTQGHSDMKLTSISQIIEVLGKVVFGLLLAQILLKRGLPEAASGAIAGVTIGSVLACFYSAVYVKGIVRSRDRKVEVNDRPDRPGKIFKSLFSIAIPVVLGSSVLHLINLIDTKLIMKLLQDKAGLDVNAAAALFGVYGKVQTLFNLPSAFIVPLTVSVIPAISAFAAKRKNAEAAETTRASMKMTTLLAFPAGVGLSVLARPIMNVLYPGSLAEGVGLLNILGISSYFVCLCLITNAILQAYGHERLPIFTIIIGGVIKICIAYVLIGNPKYGIYGAAISTLICDAVIAVLNLLLTKIVVPKAPSYRKIFIMPVICSLVMGVAAYGSYTLLEKSMGFLGKYSMLVSMALAIIIAVIVYLIAIIVTKTLAYEDVKLLPKGEKLAKLLKIR